MEEAAEKARVNKSIVMICSQWLRVTCDSSFGCSWRSILAGASKRTAAKIVMRVRWRIARRRADNRVSERSCPDCSLWTRVRNIF